MTKKSYAFPIYAPVQTVTLPRPFKDCYGLRIASLSFKFQDFDKKVFLLSILSYDNNTYFDGANKEYPYTYIHFNDGSKNTINYSNTLNNLDTTFNRRDIISITFNIKIDNELDTIVNTSNPCYIELEFFSN